jgi:hypothetical protein
MKREVEISKAISSDAVQENSLMIKEIRNSNNHL